LSKSWPKKDPEYGEDVSFCVPGNFVGPVAPNSTRQRTAGDQKLMDGVRVRSWSRKHLYLHTYRLASFGDFLLSYLMFDDLIGCSDGMF
jgi:hypothetical protein